MDSKEESREIPPPGTGVLESIETNNDLNFDVNNEKIGSEFMKIYIGNLTNKGVGFRLIVRPGVEELFPPEYLNIICGSIGKLLADSTRMLSFEKN